jgi:hypothetical protein
MTNKWQDFEFFGWDEDPIGKYTQPKKNPRASGIGQGYPEEDVDRLGTKTYGRYIDNGRYGKHKTKIEIRGCKNTERGKQTYVDEDQRYTTPKTTGKP